MFEHLSGYDAILVTGPQKSGTHLVAAAISHDTGMELVTEGDIGWVLPAHSDLARLHDCLYLGGVVVQCPALCHIISQFAAPDRLVVLIRRDPAAISASQQRRGWMERAEHLELAKYRDFTGTLTERKYAAWEAQKPSIPHWLEVEYESMVAHPLWEPDHHLIEDGAYRR